MAVNPLSSIPIYSQIVEYIHGAIAAGVYRPGEAIPSLRALALEFGVNPNTVQRAFQELERDGAIQPRKGLGMFVTENGAATARTRSEAAVYAAFVQGVQAGRAANMPAEKIRSSFDRAWEDAQMEVRDKT